MKSYVNGDKGNPTVENILNVNSVLSLKSRPDVYYLIFDRYASEDTLNDLYNYDNTEFYNYLEEKGFYVARKSKSNYASTMVSLGSSLNFEYHDQEYSKKGYTSKVINNKVQHVLKELGYKFIYIGSFTSSMGKNKLADININRSTMSYFATYLYKYSLLYPFAETFFGIGMGKDQYKRIMYEFGKFIEIAELKEPTLTIAHFCLPHDPYVFHPDGRYKKTIEQMKKEIKENYIDQLIFANKKIKETIEIILSKSETQPIIIIQSDEGPKSNIGFNSTDVISNLKYHQGILNVYSFPDQNYTSLYPSISPVNSFRVVFNEYFGANLDLLDDNYYAYYEGELSDVGELIK